MRIGYDVSPLTADRTGIGNYSYFLLKHLVQQHGDWHFSGLSSGRRAIDLEELESRVAHRHVGLPTRVLYALWNIGFPKVEAFTGPVDVFHATNFFLPPVRAARRVLSVYDLAFLAAPDLCAPEIVGPFARRIRRFAREADAILTCSEASRRDIIEHLEVEPGQVVVAPGAVDEGFKPMERAAAAARLASDHGIEGPYLLFVGTLEPRKNVEGLLRGFAEAQEHIPHKLLLVGGLGPNAGGILATLDALNLGDRVVRLGYVAFRDELPAFYSAADAFVFPSFYEGFGLPILEAMACGCPVVTARNSSIPEAAGDAALYADPSEPGSIAEAIRSIIDDTALRESLAARGIEQAKRFSWETCAQITADLYERLVSRA